MNVDFSTSAFRLALAAALAAGVISEARADAITEWNARANSIVEEGKLGTPPAVRVLAVAHTAMHEAVEGLSRAIPASGSASAAVIDAAVASASRVALSKMLPAQLTSIDAAYRVALARIPDGAEKDAGVAAGEQAATAVLNRRAGDSIAAADAYRPHASPGVYVPTSAPAAASWPRREPWLMKTATQFRPVPPPALKSDAWTRDYNEVKSLGARTSSIRTAEQTQMAHFWEYSMPSIYHGVVRSVAAVPGRDIRRNARLYAAVAQAMDDAMISVFDAKYHYVFWRPVTAIRNGDQDGNDKTERDAAWVSLIEAPIHPEYPSAHAILAAAVGSVLKAEIGTGPSPVLSTASPTAKGAVRQWTSIDDFVAEVAHARIYEGIHFRTSTEIGLDMGRQIGQLAVERFLKPQP